MVTAVGVGTACVTATAASGVTAECLVTVRDVVTLILPAGLTEIGEEAFAGSACEAVIAPESCGYIGSRAFADCPNLRYVRLPASAEIAPDAFEGCCPVTLERVE